MFHRGNCEMQCYNICSPIESSFKLIIKTLHLTIPSMKYLILQSDP